MELPKLGFVGVGRMGAAMARHLQLDCGYTVAAVYDSNRSAAVSLADELGCAVADTLAAVTAASAVIITVVSNDAAMRSIYFAESDGLLTGAKGKLFINCATLSPEIHRSVESAGHVAGAAVIEAAMASSIPQARSGKLFLMVGGVREDFERATPLLQAMSTALHYTGPMGSAAAVKAIVNMVMNCNTAALAEGLGLADALGLELPMVKNILSQTGANARVIETDADDMINRDHAVFFSAEHAAKDSGIALDLATAQGISLPVAAATKSQYERMVSLGLGQLDKSGVAELTFKGRHG